MTTSKARALVVDDEIYIQEILTSTLEEAGYNVVAVGSVDAALQALGNQKFDLAFVDIRMPGKPGTELLQLIKSTHQDVVVIMITALDAASTAIETIKLGVGYEVEGRRIDVWPSSGSTLARATPIYEDFPGWEEPIHGARTLADLPENARRYVTALEEHAGVPVVLVSVGPERTQTIERAWRPLRHRPGSGLERPAPGAR